jgi:hypothetical protein
MSQMSFTRVNGVWTPVEVKFKISNSKARTWRRCPKKYEYKYVHRLRAKQKSIPLERGSWMHELLQAHYEGKDWRKIHKQKTKQFNRLFEEEREMLGDMPGDCARIMRSYLRQYGEEDSHFRVIDVELDEYVTLPNGLRVQVIIDLIYEDYMGLWLMDHKFRGRFEAGENMRLDPQLTVYYWALEILGYPCVGTVYNEVLTKPPTVPKLTATGTRLEKRKNIATNQWTYAEAVKAHGFELSDYSDILRTIGTTQKGRFFRRTYMPRDPAVVRNAVRDLNSTAQEIISAEAKGRFPRTFDKSCKFGCEFMDLCLTQYHGGDGESIIKSYFTRKEQD